MPARRPPALKAIISVCSTEDRFGGDIHYMGGGLLNDNLWWGSIMLAYQARPADPALVGDAWRPQWIERLRHTPFWPAPVMATLWAWAAEANPANSVARIAEDRAADEICIRFLGFLPPAPTGCGWRNLVSIRDRPMTVR